MSVGILYGNFKWGIIKINNIFDLFILQYPMLREVILYIEKKMEPHVCAHIIRLGMRHAVSSM